MLPSRIYKYRSLSGDSFKYTMDILLNSRVYIPHIKQLNDPFEGAQNIVLNFTDGTKIKLDSTVYDGLTKSWGVYSLSASPKIPQMWTHYSDNFRGICIEFSTANTFSTIKEVKYVKKIITEHDLVKHNGQSSLAPLFEEVLIRKSDGWSYEEEWRFIDLYGENYCLPLEKADITSVIFGALISDYDKQYVIDWIRTRDDIKLKKCNIKENSYEIEIVDY